MIFVDQSIDISAEPVELGIPSPTEEDQLNALGERRGVIFRKTCLLGY